MPDSPVTNRPWMRTVLWLAAAYNVVWGAGVVLAPGLAFSLAGIDQPLYPSIWQCVGMIVGAYGLGYAIAASDPLRHWPIVLVGLVGKVLGPIGFLMTASKGELPWSFGWTIIFNDLIWWAPFGLILAAAYRRHEREASARIAAEDRDVAEAMASARTEQGRSMLGLSHESPLLVVFLRHLGCTFCREALADLRERREAIEAAGARIVVVHMGTDAAAARLMERYGVADLPRIADPDRTLYDAFELKRGTLGQLFGMTSWVRGVAATLRGHMVGGLAGDGFQMPGAFLIREGRIVQAFRHKNAADRPDYERLACVLAAPE